MYHYVYEIKNKVNGRKYIGKRSSEKEPEKDWYMGSGFALKKAKEKYGIENFEKKILKVFETSHEALEYEKEIILEKNACESEEYYNIAEGGRCGYLNKGKSDKEKKIFYENLSEKLKGENNPRYGKPLSEYTKMKISKANKEAWKNNEKRRENARIARTGKNNPMYGKTTSEYHKKRVSEVHKGRVKSEKERENISKSKMGENNPMYGKKFTEEHRKKLSDARKGDKHWNYGNHMSEENKKKLSELWKGKKMGGDNPFARKVVCLNTGEIFDAIADAGRKYNVVGGNISGCCRGKKKSAGKLNGEKLKWMYYDEYLKCLQ